MYRRKKYFCFRCNKQVPSTKEEIGGMTMGGDVYPISYQRRCKNCGSMVSAV